MAESDSGQERTEEPTGKRLQESRDKGQVARSRELNTLAVVMVAAVGLLTLGPAMVQKLMNIMSFNFSIEREALYSNDSMGLHLFASVGEGLEVLGPLFFLLLVASIVGPVLLGGWLFSIKSLAPKFERMNPLAGLKRMFSLKALVELLKALGKFLVVLGAALLVLHLRTEDLLSMGQESLQSAIVHCAWVLASSLIILSASLILIAAVDVPFQLWDHKQKLRMTKQEVKDEFKDSEGKPEVKGRIRQLQREMAERRMMDKVPQADVVITNPTHFAVALKYDPLATGAPVLLAKGADLVAQRIREVASENQIVVLESAPLARAVFYSTELDREIPAGLYLAVAQVLAYVFQLRQFRAGQGKRPGPMPQPPIPDDLKR
ncbi:flagellar biosynthesis protein FlhB [Pseudomonas abyssi]|uniref:Flagellar biosynthetic protein FlhB n=2 Tax=Pseudomonas abyssi TaxID=170540 RepID=A0A2A3MLG3_9PSED|nr:MULTISPECIES: flagellar biosynthesis protein FlhB [Pseudomonadaceae]MAD01193.1 flagellar biosynthesis protein FlhB [Pseudomonadales bacterium]MAG67930.1 flagellar biosynthesis protein FlhB [Pseudomonadales bacterium]PBK05632.1 flagellar biosynthesis protein FlhB [Pseudomonas abyssi]RGP56425.1 flagellar biosynthetic protein FlhB [Halopseudomonas gallaeciensis]|tara:strand:+ start:78889 stop:80019 length:1131 start_codon:yes stop_codon:yes gene_type:complete